MVSSDCFTKSEDTGLFDTYNRNSFYSTENELNEGGHITDMTNMGYRRGFEDKYDTYYLKGYFQTYEYFDEYRDDVLQIIRKQNVDSRDYLE